MLNLLSRAKPLLHKILGARNMARLFLAKRAPPVLHSSLAGALLALQESKATLRVLQIGAFDGISYDPLHSFLAEFQPPAVLLEPVQSSFVNLKRTYEAFPSIRTVNAALGETTGTATMFCVDPSFAAPVLVLALSSFRREVIESYEQKIPGISGAIHEIEVPTICAADLWKMCGEGRPDVLVIDTEGFDFRVMQLLGVPEFRPSIIYFEHVNLTTLEFQQAMYGLTNAAYKIILDGQDALAIANNEIPKK